MLAEFDDDAADYVGQRALLLLDSTQAEEGISQENTADIRSGDRLKDDRNVDQLGFLGIDPEKTIDVEDGTRIDHPSVLGDRGYGICIRAQ